MQLQELRIGNYISDLDGKIIKVEELTICSSYTTKKRINNLPFDYYKPIPLTEEMLLKFGFEVENKTENGILYDYLIAYVSYPKNFQIHSKDREFFALSKYNNGQKYFKYVHQLQNLYFTLTGEELTFKN